MKKIKLAIGFVCYGDLTVKYLPSFLPSLVLAAAQTEVEVLILAFDNLPSDISNREYIEKNFPEIKIRESEANLGFGRAYNQLILEAESSGADYFLVTNPDTYYSEDSLEKMLAALELDDKLGSVAPKVLQWDFARGKNLKIIDTLGIVKMPGLRFADLGQGKEDNNAFDNIKILGPSGAAGMFRLKALQSIKVGGEFYDELMFMYKEDCDLAMRLQLAGWTTELIPDAHVWHDRTVSGRGNNLISFWSAFNSQTNQTKLWSYHNQFIIYYKFWRFENIFSILVMVIYATMRLVYSWIFNRALWREIKAVWLIRKRIIIPGKKRV